MDWTGWPLASNVIGWPSIANIGYRWAFMAELLDFWKIGVRNIVFGLKHARFWSKKVGDLGGALNCMQIITWNKYFVFSWKVSPGVLQGVSSYFTILCVPVHQFEKIGGALCFTILCHGRWLDVLTEKLHLLYLYSFYRVCFLLCPVRWVTWLA